MAEVPIQNHRLQRRAVPGHALLTPMAEDPGGWMPPGWEDVPFHPYRDVIPPLAAGVTAKQHMQRHHADHDEGEVPQHDDAEGLVALSKKTLEGSDHHRVSTQESIPNGA